MSLCKDKPALPAKVIYGNVQVTLDIAVGLSELHAKQQNCEYHS